MQVTCVLCGQIMNVADDVRGASYTVGALGHVVKNHIGKDHASTKQQVYDDPRIFPPEATLPQLITIMGVTFQSLIVYSYFKSDDPVFLEQIRLLREVIEKAGAQKVHAAPAVTV